MRLQATIAGQKKLEEQEIMMEETEGVRKKTSNRRSSATVKKMGKNDKHHAEDQERDIRVKRRLKKIIRKKDKVKEFTDPWKDYGPIRSNISLNQWQKYSPYIGKITKYDGFTGTNVQNLYRLRTNQEHKDRKIMCTACEKPIDTQNNFSTSSNGISYHIECLNAFL